MFHSCKLNKFDWNDCRIPDSENYPVSTSRTSCSLSIVTRLICIMKPFKLVPPELTSLECVHQLAVRRCMVGHEGVLCPFYKSWTRNAVSNCSSSVEHSRLRLINILEWSITCRHIITVSTSISISGRRCLNRWDRTVPDLSDQLPHPASDLSVINVSLHLRLNTIHHSQWASQLKDFHPEMA